MGGSGDRVAAASVEALVYACDVSPDAVRIVRRIPWTSDPMAI